MILDCRKIEVMVLVFVLQIGTNAVLVLQLSN